ncbi:hypothetical protein EYC80_001949 [Monilinia laxa]|uniref:Uncharacterized protein n=1 Tax=Monilinia laxa TaxID=61186 RepID=A0A5N6K6I0_MONLA|nr:hypothetical protein EYC80_001949 [Monilinia laxa]
MHAFLPKILFYASTGISEDKDKACCFNTSMDANGPSLGTLPQRIKSRLSFFLPQSYNVLNIILQIYTNRLRPNIQISIDIDQLQE